MRIIPKTNCHKITRKNFRKKNLTGSRFIIEGALFSAQKFAQKFSPNILNPCKNITILYLDYTTSYCIGIKVVRHITRIFL